MAQRGLTPKYMTPWVPRDVRAKSEQHLWALNLGEDLPGRVIRGPDLEVGLELFRRLGFAALDAKERNGEVQADFGEGWHEPEGLRELRDRLG